MDVPVSPVGPGGSGIMRSPWGFTVTAFQGSHVPGSVWPAAVVVCGGWIMGRLEMGMLMRVWTGSCWVAASVVAAAAWGGGGGGGSGFGGWGVLVRVRVRVRVVSLGLSSLFLWFWGLRGVVLVVVLLLLVWSFWFRLGFGVGLWVGVRFEVEEDLVPEVRGHRCRVGGVPGVLLGCLGCLCVGPGPPGTLACGCSFGFRRGLVDEVGGEGGVGG